MSATSPEEATGFHCRIFKYSGLLVKRLIRAPLVQRVERGSDFIVSVEIRHFILDNSPQVEASLSIDLPTENPVVEIPVPLLTATLWHRDLFFDEPAKEQSIPDVAICPVHAAWLILFPQMT